MPPDLIFVFFKRLIAMNGNSFLAPRNLRRGFLYLAALAVMAGNAWGVSSVGAVYAEKPVWWNDVVPLKPTGKIDRAEEYWNWLQANNPSDGKLLDNWYVIGPFDGGNGSALDKPYAPEIAGARMPVRGAGVRQVSWQPWPPGTACPLTNQPPDTIVYATRKFTLTAQADGGLIVSSRAGYRLWVDGQPVVNNGAACNKLYLPLRLSAGSHTLLVKAYLADGAWNWSANWSAGDPRYTEIKLRSLVLSLWSRDETALRIHGPRLAALYLELEDSVNSRYWVGYALSASRDNTPDAGAMIGRWVAAASRNPGAGGALLKELGQFLVRLPRQDPLRPVLIDAMYNLGLALSCPDETAAFLRAAGIAKPAPERALRMAQAYQTSNMLDSVSFWIEPYLKEFLSTDPADYIQLRRTVNDWLQRPTDPFRQALYESIERAVNVGSNDEARAVLAECYMKDVLARKDTGRAAQFLKTHAVALAAKQAFDAAIWRLQVAILENNESAAREALNGAVLARPSFTNSLEYSKYWTSLFKFSTTVTLPASVESTPDEAPSSMDRLAKAGSTNRLCMYLRDVLRARGDSTVPAEGDANLFAGAKPYYRKALGVYAPVYEAWLRNEIETLNAEPLRRQDALRLDRVAHLAPPAAANDGGLTADGKATVSAPISTSGFVPLIDMTPGLPEVIEDQLRYTLKAEPAQAASLTVRDGDVWLANSRMLACLRGGEVAWSWAAPLSCPPSQQGRAPNFRMGGRCESAAAGGIVAVRILLPDATPAVAGLDRATGAYRWTWRPDKGMIAGAPAAWGTNRLVVLTVTEDDMEGYRTDLVVLDTRSEAQTEVHLGGRKVGGPTRLIGDRLIDPDSFWQAPPPVVDGDIAYVSTALGLLGAVNLADESIVWLRNYSHHYDDSVTGLRVPRPPVVGRNTVLFAPPDSNRLILTDKATGRLVASRTDLVWTEVAPCGPDNAVVLTLSSAAVFSLSDLAERRLSSGRIFGVLQPVREGCLLAERNGAVTLCGADGKLTALAPASDSVRLLGRGPDGVCYGAGGAGGQWCGVVGNRAGPPPSPIRPQRNLTSICDMAQGILSGTNGAVPLASNRLLLIGVGADGRRLWELPAVLANGLVSDKGRVMTARGGRIWVYDERTADLLGSWPSGFGSAESARLVVAAPEGGYAIGPGADQRMTLWRLAAEGTAASRMVAQWPPNAFDAIVKAAVIQTDTQIVAMVQLANAIGAVTLWTAPRGVAGAVFERKTGDSGAAFLWISTDGGRAAILSQQSSALIVADAAGLREINSNLSPGKSWGSRGIAYALDDLLFLHRDDKTLVALNPMTGSSLNLTHAGIVMPNAAGNRIYGLKVAISGRGYAARIEKLQPYTCAVDGRSAPLIGPPLPAGVDVNGATGALAQIDGKPILIASGAALAWQGTVARDPVPLPPIADHRTYSQHPAFQPYAMAWSAPNGIVNVAGVWMNPNQWQSLLHLPDSIHTGALKPRALNVDGFLDEWPTNAFFDIPLGRMAVCTGEAGELDLAIEINDAALAERLGVEGLDDRLTISAMELRSLCLAEYAAPPMRPTLKAFRRATIEGQEFEFAWTVTADGRHCRIEATVRGVPHDLKIPRKAQSWDDVALRLLWRRNAFEQPVNLVADGGSGPLSYARVVFR